MVFVNALRSLSDSGLPEEDSILARDILNARAVETINLGTLVVQLVKLEKLEKQIKI